MKTTSASRPNYGFNQVASGFIKVTAMVALTFGSFMAKAGNGNSENTKPAYSADKPEKTIENHIRFPKLIVPIHKSEKVEVIFTTDAGGKVDCVIAKTQNEELRKEIEKQFSALVLPNMKSNIAYSIILNFKTL